MTDQEELAFIKGMLIGTLITVATIVLFLYVALK